MFRAFHHDWVTDIARALSRDVLPPDYHALPEQLAGGPGPDVFTLRLPGGAPPPTPSGGVGLAETPPQARYHIQSEPNQYAT
jgi:hypothetical protein